MGTITSSKDVRVLDKLERKGKVPEPTESAIEFRSYYKDDVIYYTPGRKNLDGTLVPGEAVEFTNCYAKVDSEAAIKYLRAHREYGRRILEKGVHF